MARFEGTETYVATEDLTVAVNAAIVLERPLAGEGRARHRQNGAGRGDRQRGQCAASHLAHQVHHQGPAGALRIRCGFAPARQPARRSARVGHPPLHQARQAVGRLRARASGRCCSSTRSTRPTSSSRTTFCSNSTAWSSTSTRPARPCGREKRPIVIITSNNEKELPDAFLRRCFFHYIKFPDERDDGPDHRRALSRHQAPPRRGGAEDLLRDPRGAGPEEKAFDLRTCSTG